MKLIVLFVAGALFSAHANSVAQSVTIKGNDLSVKEIFATIESQTGYVVFGNTEIFDVNKRFTLNVRNMELKKLLDHIVKDISVDYTLSYKSILIFKKETKATTTYGDLPESDTITMKPVAVYSGRIQDEDGNPLPNASVRIKGAQRGVMTDANGRFTIEAEPGQILIVSYTGYQSQEIALQKNQNITVTLSIEINPLQEIQVIAYGTTTKGVSTTSISQINYEDIQNRPLTNIASAIEGIASGVQSIGSSGRPGASPIIRVRGFGSINASQAPLFVVDGAIYGDGMSNINMEDVQSVSVLKGASAAALYGSRGANGVIIITTKKGKGKGGVSFKVAQGLSNRMLPEYDRLNAYEYYPTMWKAYRNTLMSSGMDLEQANAEASLNIVNILGYNPFNVADNQVIDENGNLNPEAKLLWADDLDWTEAAARTGYRQEYSISMDGAAEKTNYYMSFSYLDEKGLIKNTDLNHLTGRANLSGQPTKWLKAGLNLSGTLTNSQQGASAGSNRLGNPFFFNRTIGPIYPVFMHDPFTGDYILDAEGNRIYDLGAGQSSSNLHRPAAAYPGRNPVMEVGLDKEFYTRTFSSARGFAEVSPVRNLKLTTNINADITSSDYTMYENPIVGEGAPSGYLSKSNTRTTSYTFNQLLEYTKTFNQHQVSLMAGHENYSRNIQYNGAERTDQIMDGIYELTNFTTAGNSSSYTDNYRIESYLSRIGYNFNDKYILEGSMRYDGNSRFRSDLRWMSFYAFSGAWRIDKESFFTAAPHVNMLKLRASYGQVGNDAGIGYYPYQALYALGFNNANEPGIRQSTIGSSDLTWETQKSFDVAVDFALFQNRLNGTVEYYHKNSDGLIFDVQLPLHYGGYFVSKNVGALTNSGIELNLNGDLIRTRDWKWNMDINFATLTNKITRMPPDQPEIISGSKKLSVGHSIYDFWLVIDEGVDPETGVDLFRANDTDPSVAGNIIRGKDTLTTVFANAAYGYVGSAIPDFFGNIKTSVSYKNLIFSVMLSYQVGGLINDGTYSSLMHYGSYGAAWHRDILKAWEKPGDITNVPRLDNSRVKYATSRFLTDASYLNVRNLSIAYNLPIKLLERVGANSARIYANAENVYLFSARRGMNVLETFTGTTSHPYFPTRTISFGLNVNF